MGELKYKGEIKYEVEKGIPIPEPGKYEGKYPFRLMEIGDSFLVPNEQYGKVKVAHMSYFGSVVKRLLPKKFISRKTPEGLRVWRVE